MTTDITIPTIADIAHRVVTSEGDVAKSDVIRLASFILDSHEQIAAHYEHLQLARPATPSDAPRELVPRPRGPLTDRLAASDPAKQIDGTTAETERTS